MSTMSEMERSSTEMEVGYEETALTLGLPGGSRAGGSDQQERKHGFSETADLSHGSSGIETRRGGDLGDESPDCAASGAGRPPASKARVVGWPPVRSYRKNALRSCTYVKVAVDGAPYLRKVDLETYSGYHQLLIALQEMFSCFTIRDRRLVDLVKGTDYIPTYEDKDGDWMLVGDVPWKMFVASCKRLRLMKSSEAVNIAPRAPQ
ncbi:auxin-responsive protein IAA1-like [Phoenix dactylifera]|uniref:Auxin-responsive protein n=1 Tax=Phoenix dactylifera TaxID=42345 RepID=A0A8B7BV01_PHODC|nr:auxin-responsive protein IAA1-like [Phoenix dactylifera]